MTASELAIELTITAAKAASSRKAQEIIALDVSGRLPLTDVFLICSGNSERQVSAIIDAIDEAMHKAGMRQVRKEGVSQCRWVLLDYSEIVVHVQHSEDRGYYGLERLWRDCPVIDLPADVVESPAVSEVTEAAKVTDAGEASESLVSSDENGDNEASETAGQ